MAAALLAKLKINNPPALKKEMEIRIRANKEDIPVEEGDVIEQPRPMVNIIDETKKGDFDRAAFLKNFQKPKIINTVAQAPAGVQAPAIAPALTAPAVTVPKKITLKKPAGVKTKAQAPAIAPAIAPAGEDQEHEAQEPAAVITGKTIKIRTARKTKNPAVGVKEGPLTMLTIGDADIETRLKRKNEAPIVIPASAYYMNNREIFVNFMASLFSKYKKKLSDEAAAPATCPGDNDVNDFSLMTHQQIVKEYLNLYTPYRGLLLYHGLGSGKTCSSIAIAEGLKQNKKVIIMTPASLQVNYREELKKCGDDMYQKNQYWEFIRTTDEDPELINTLSSVLALSVDYINKQGGAWMVNMAKPANYDDLTPGDKTKLDSQIEQMIAHKYRFINYNGLRMTKIAEMTENNTINPFDNAVVIVDEAHNLVSRIVNKIGKKKQTIAISLYTLLMKAKNAKIVLLSGTPVINYPN